MSHGISVRVRQLVSTSFRRVVVTLPPAVSFPRLPSRRPRPPARSRFCFCCYYYYYFYKWNCPFELTGNGQEWRTAYSETAAACPHPADDLVVTVVDDTAATGLGDFETSETIIFFFLVCFYTIIVTTTQNCKLHMSKNHRKRSRNIKKCS